MSFDIYEAFATDENLENNGTTFPLGKDATLLIARSGNRKYKRALTKQVEQHKLDLDFETNDDAGAEAAAKVSDEIMVDVMASTILLGWTGLSFKGVDLDYSVENAKTLLAVKDFRKQVATLSDQMDAYKVKAEAAAGNVSAAT